LRTASKSLTEVACGVKFIGRAPLREHLALSPILIRTYKKEAELELWKKARSGRFVLKSFDVHTSGRWQAIYDVTVEIEGGSKPALVAEWIAAGFL